MSELDEARQELALSCALCPDVVEWCNAPGCEDIIAYGTYKLDESTKQRDGCLVIAHFVSGRDDSQVQTTEDASLVNVGEIAFPGVYDVAWSPFCEGSGHQQLAVASADGTASLLSLCKRESDHYDVEVTASCQLTDQILTHVAWGSEDKTSLFAVGQDGMAHHVQVRPDGCLTAILQWSAHELETWSVEVSPLSPQLVVTGADDGCMAGWDLRAGSSPVFLNRRSHEAGVTALACSPHREHCLASGSYDERVRLFDIRTPARPLTESERLGDGAYHLSWHSSSPGILAVAAMRSGIALLRADGEDTCLTPWGQYATNAPEGCHGSLAYGVSWRASSCQGRLYGASASFYDCSVHVWSAAMTD